MEETRSVLLSTIHHAYVVHIQAMFYLFHARCCFSPVIFRQLSLPPNIPVLSLVYPQPILFHVSLLFLPSFLSVAMHSARLYLFGTLPESESAISQPAHFFGQNDGVRLARF